MNKERKQLKDTKISLKTKIQQQQNSLRKQKKEQQLQKKRRETEEPIDPLIAKMLPQLRSFVAGLASPQHQYEAATNIRKLLCLDKNPPIEEVVLAGAVPLLVNCLHNHNNPPLQVECAWALTNIASGTSDHTDVVVKSGAVEMFVQLATSNNDEVREQALWGLGNIAGDSPKFRDYVVNLKVLPLLIHIIAQKPNINVLRTATWTLSNLFRNAPTVDLNSIAITVQCLMYLIKNEDMEVVLEASWAISYLSDCQGAIDMYIQANAVKMIVNLLNHVNPSVKNAALRTIGNFVSGTNNQTQAAIEAGALPYLHGLINHDKKSVRKEVCWALSNIAAGEKVQIQALIDSGVIPSLILALKNDEFDVKKEAAWAISNAAHGGTDEQVAFLVQMGCIPPLCALLKTNDPKVMEAVLEGVYYILDCGSRVALNDQGENTWIDLIDATGAVEIMEELQYSDTKAISEQAGDILDTYFEYEDDDDEMQPIVENNQFSFGSNIQTPQGGYNFQQQ